MFGTEIITKIDPVTNQEYRLANDPISFLWIGPVALTVNIASGLIACKIVDIISPRKEINQ